MHAPPNAELCRLTGLSLHMRTRMPTSHVPCRRRDRTHLAAYFAAGAGASLSLAVGSFIVGSFVSVLR